MSTINIRLEWQHARNRGSNNAAELGKSVFDKTLMDQQTIPSASSPFIPFDSNRECGLIEFELNKRKLRTNLRRSYCKHDLVISINRSARAAVQIVIHEHEIPLLAVRRQAKLRPRETTVCGSFNVIQQKSNLSVSRSFHSWINRIPCIQFYF